MEAYAFLAHGHVFANAQTGKVVLLAVWAAEGDWVHAGRHVPSIIACTLELPRPSFLVPDPANTPSAPPLPAKPSNGSR